MTTNRTRYKIMNIRAPLPVECQSHRCRSTTTRRRTKLLASCALLFAGLLELGLSRGSSEAALLHSGGSVPFKTSFVSSSDNMSLRRAANPAVASIRELLASAGEGPASVSESMLLDGDSSQLLVESLVGGGHSLAVANLDHHQNQQQQQQNQGSPSAMSQSDYQRDSSVGSTSHLVLASGESSLSSSQSDDLLAIPTSNQQQVVVINNEAAAATTTTTSTPAPPTTGASASTTTTTTTTTSTEIPQAHGEPTTTTTTTASVTTTASRLPTTTTTTPAPTTTTTTTTTTAAPTTTSGAPAASTSSQPITINVTGEEQQQQQQQQLQQQVATNQSAPVSIVSETNQRAAQSESIATTTTTTTTTAVADTKAPAGASTTRAPATSTQQPAAPAGRANPSQGERESRTVGQDERLQPQHGAYGGRVVLSSVSSSVANSSRGFFMATAPALERWPAAAKAPNSTTTNANTPSEPVRVVNEFVFLPEDSLGPIELDQSEFANTTSSLSSLSSSSNDTRSLPAEHRTLGDETDPMDGPPSGATAGNSSLMLLNDNGEVELDYINLDSGDQEAAPETGAAPDLQDRAVPTGGLSFATTNGKPAASATTTSTTKKPTQPAAATSPTSSTTTTSTTTTATTTTTTTTTPKPTSVKVNTTTSKQPEQRVSQSITISELRSERNKLAATTTTTTTTTTKRPTERQRSVTTPLVLVVDESLQVVGDQQRRQAPTERKNNKFLLEPEGDRRRPTTTTTTTSTTTVKPNQQVAAARAASSRRLSSTSQNQQLHKQVFSEPSLGAGGKRQDWQTRRRRPADTFSPVNNGADEEEASILTRYSMSSPLSRLSSLGRGGDRSAQLAAVAPPIRSQRREPAPRVPSTTSTSTSTTTTSRPARMVVSTQTPSSFMRSNSIQVRSDTGREQVATTERDLVSRVLDEEDEEDKEGERQQPRLMMTLISSSMSSSSSKIGNQTVSQPPVAPATTTTTSTSTTTTLRPPTSAQPITSTSTTTIANSVTTSSAAAAGQQRQQATQEVRATASDDEETLVELLIKDEQDRQRPRQSQSQATMTKPNTATSTNSYGNNNNNNRKQQQQQVVANTDYGDSGKWQPDTNVDYSLIQDYDYKQSQPGAHSSPGTNNLPGRPGIDYPVHWQVPRTSFDCRNYELTGFYADVESDCQAYHSCHRGRGGRHTFLCPNGTLFSQELLTCDWWYNVECSQSKLYMPSAPNQPAAAAAAQSFSVELGSDLGNEQTLSEHELSPTGGRPQLQQQQQQKPANLIKRTTPTD